MNKEAFMMLHPLPVMRFTKFLGIVTTLFLIVSGAAKHFGVLGHEVFLFPAIICIFEVLAYRVFRLKDSNFVSAKTLKREDKVSKPELDAFVRMCINYKHIFMLTGVFLSLVSQTPWFCILAAPVYVVYCNCIQMIRETPVPLSIRKSVNIDTSHRTTAPRMGKGRVYNSALSKSLGVDMWS